MIAVSKGVGKKDNAVLLFGRRVTLGRPSQRDGDQIISGDVPRLLAVTSQIDCDMRPVIACNFTHDDPPCHAGARRKQAPHGVAQGIRSTAMLSRTVSAFVVWFPAF